MTHLFGPGWGNYAIQGIVEIEVPAGVSMQPQTPGWYGLALVFVAAGLWFFYALIRRYVRNRYRRDAVKRLSELRARYLAGEPEALRGLAPLLRATALAAGDRTQIAQLQGDEWQEMLNQMAPKIAPVPVGLLEKLAYQPSPGLVSEQYAELFPTLKRWIVKHKYSHA